MMRLLCLCVHRNMNVIIPPHPTPPPHPPTPPNQTRNGWFPASMCADDRSLCADDAVSLCADDSFAKCADDSLSMCADDALTLDPPFFGWFVLMCRCKQTVPPKLRPLIFLLVVLGGDRSPILIWKRGSCN